MFFFGFAYVQANKTKNFQYQVPANFELEANLFPTFFPTTYNSKGPEQITVMIPPEIKTRLGSPKTKAGELNPDFLNGKKTFNQQFGIRDWNLDNYKFTNTQYGERLELNGTYTSMGGIKTDFIEHYYFGKTVAQSIHMYYPAQARGKVVDQAKLSLQTFNPNIN